MGTNWSDFVPPPGIYFEKCSRVHLCRIALASLLSEATLASYLSIRPFYITFDLSREPDVHLYPSHSGMSITALSYVTCSSNVTEKTRNYEKCMNERKWPE